MCSMVVVYPEPVESLLCDALTTDRDAQALTKVPEIVVTAKLAGLKGLLVMFDPDATVSEEPQDGFVHFIAYVTVDSSGKVIMNKIITDYYPPTPPRKSGPHRYQFFLFDYEDGSPIPPSSQRKFQICSFMRSNNINQPVAAFQFQHARQ
ncbi:hypothetical protein Btru_063203 [Bulinus truncatus]|nr:hypothetical protein Btru_063203 [Bulinus truncatus]